MKFADGDVFVEVRDGAIIVTPKGDVDMSRSPSLLESLKQAVEKRPARIVVNLTDVQYMDSSGLATLVQARRSLPKQSGSKAPVTDMVLCNMPERVRSIFEIARLDTFFRIVGSLDEALAR